MTVNPFSAPPENVTYNFSPLANGAKKKLDIAVQELDNRVVETTIAGVDVRLAGVEVHGRTAARGETLQALREGRRQSPGEESAPVAGWLPRTRPVGRPR